jgi:hypothetical protein
MSTELSRATRGTALLSINLKNNPIPGTVLNKILSDIPAAWAERSINNKGVLDLNLNLATSNSINKGLVGNVEYVVISDLLKQKLNLVQENIRQLSSIENAATIRDPLTGARLVDLKQYIADLQEYVIDEIMSPVRSLGLTRNLELTLYYYQDRKASLQHKLALFKSEAALVKEAYDDYRPRRAYNETETQPFNTTNAGFNYPLSADAIEKVISLSSEGKSEAYRQGLNRNWLEVKMKAAKIENKILEIDHVIKAIQESGASESLSSVRQTYLTRVEQELPGILDKLGNYLDATQRIYKQLSSEHIGANSYLYRSISNAPYIEGNSTGVIKRKILILAALLVLTTIVVIPLLMIRNSLRNRKA